jgi:hypothetical protein
MTNLVAAFPATGKTHYAATHPNVLDSDSSRFSWCDSGGQRVRNPAWPQNYLDHIARGLRDGATVLVSTHAEVRAALRDAGLPFTLVYPDAALRDEYVQRMTDRGSPPTFVAMVADQWDQWIAELADQAGCVQHIVLGSGEYLSDAFVTQDPIS